MKQQQTCLSLVFFASFVLFLGGSCGNDQEMQMTLDPCAKDAFPKTCWDFSQDYTQRDLIADGWSFDPCFQEKTGSFLQTLRFPEQINTSGNWNYCYMNSPLISVENSKVTHIQLNMIHELSFTGLGNDASLYYVKIPEKTEHGLFRLVNTNSSEYQTTLEINSQRQFSFHFRYVVGPGTMYPEGTWKIYKFQLTPLCDGVPCSLN